MFFGSGARTGPPHFRLAGIPVRVEPSFWVVTVLLGLTPWITPTLLGGWVLIVFVSILVHELGHAVAFRRYGSSPTITLHAFGGLTVGRAVEGRGRAVVVAVAGPLAGLVLLGLPALAAAGSDWSSDGEAYVLARMAVWVNVWWSFVNLAPLVPLDGGQVTEQLVGRRGARVITIVVAIPLAVFAFSQELIFGGVIAGYLAVRAFQELQARPQEAPTPAQVLRGIDGALLSGQPVPTPLVVALAESDLADQLAAHLLEQSGPGPPRAVARLVEGLVAAGWPGQAAIVAERLAADPRADRAWAASAAAAAWQAVGDDERAARWRA